MPAGNQVERESPVIVQAGRASLAGSFGDAGYPICGSRAVVCTRREDAYGRARPRLPGNVASFKGIC